MSTDIMLIKLLDMDITTSKSIKKVQRCNIQKFFASKPRMIRMSDEISM